MIWMLNYLKLNLKKKRYRLNKDLKQGTFQPITNIENVIISNVDT